MGDWSNWDCGIVGLGHFHTSKIDNKSHSSKLVAGTTKSMKKKAEMKKNYQNAHLKYLSLGVETGSQDRFRDQDVTLSVSDETGLETIFETKMVSIPVSRPASTPKCHALLPFTHFSQVLSLRSITKLYPLV